MTNRPTIVIPAFRRDTSLKRLLNSIREAWFPEPPVIVISLEGGATQKVLDVAEEFKRSFPNVFLKKHDKCLGLRRHIIECGDHALTDGSVIILEDDLWVDRYFYYFAVQALDDYAENENVAGIALYSPQFSEISQLPFIPIHNGYDTYPMRTPCSWGQAWSAAQWKQFKDWYQNTNESNLRKIEGLPESVKNWPESSWKKYFAGYICVKSLYFVYPYQPYATNCSDAGGTHIVGGTDQFQVTLADQMRVFPILRFAPVEKTNAVSYDSYMECSGDVVFRALKMSRDEVEIDLHGSKPLSLLRLRKFALTIRSASAVEREYPLAFRPPEMNLLFAGPSARGKPSLKLVKSSDLNFQKPHRLSIKEYSYHARLNAESGKLAFLSLTNFPKRIMIRAMGKITSVLRQGKIS